MSLPYKTIEITKVSDFVAHIEGLKDGHRALFRGQAVDKPLLPTIARVLRTVDMKKSEVSFLQEFRRRAAAFLDVSKHDEWRLLTVAQHTGSPTRLLDWSRNPLAALWFAVATSDGINQAVVWQVMLDKSDYVTDDEMAGSPFELGRTKFFQPDHISPRVLAQESYFSVHRYWAEANKGRYVALEDQKEFKGKLTKYLVEIGCEESLLIQLDRLGLNFGNLLPDLEGLSKHLASRYDFMIREVSFQRMISGISSELNSKKRQ